MMNGENDKILRCSFCGKGQEQGIRLIAGPTIYICNECIAICNEIIADDPAHSPHLSLTLNEKAGRARPIHLILTDCDGVLTDGGLLYLVTSDQVSTESKAFHIHDGHGLKMACEAGLKTGIISGRASRALEVRARELQVDYLYQGIETKLAAYEEILAKEGLSDEQVAYIGDDLLDLPVLRRVGLAIAPADAVSEVRKCAHLVTQRPGGYGVVREAVEFILKAQGQWEKMLAKF